MRSALFVLAIAALTPAAAEVPNELFTVPNAILCVHPLNLEIANHPSVARSQLVLRAMGCLRTDAGVRTRLLEQVGLGDAWRVRFYPAGISSGVVLWGMPSSFTMPDGSETAATKRTGL